MDALSGFIGIDTKKRIIHLVFYHQRVIWVQQCRKNAAAERGAPEE